MLRLLLLICSFQIFSALQSGSHSLWNFATFIIGHTPFPEFNMVVMLDDFQLSSYAINVRNLNYTHYKSESECTMPGSSTIVFGDLYDSMKTLALFTKHQLNLTHGVHVHQALTGCELLNETSSRFRSWEAFNGVITERTEFNVEEKALHSEGLRTKMWGHIGRKSEEILHANVYHPICINSLKNCLHKRKNDVMRKVKPRVRLLQKTLPDSRGTKVTCLATGFYPRHLKLTLLRDGQPVPDHQITGGELLPNADGTYQMRKSLEVSAEELREKHQYTCTAEHLSLDNKLDIGLDLGPGGAVPIVIPVVLLGLVLLCVGGVVFMRYRGHRSTSDYVPAQKTNQHLHQMDQSAH